MYDTLHSDGKTKGRVSFTVWSEVFSCPECVGEIVFHDEALDDETKAVRKIITCPGCGAQLKRRQLQKRFDTIFDKAIGRSVEVPKRVPILIAYKVGTKTFQKKPGEHDLDLIAK